jgi:hypothetical protein
MGGWQALEDNAMATGKQMLEAVLEAVKRRPDENELRINQFDIGDLLKLDVAELHELGVADEQAELIVADLAHEKLTELSAWVGALLVMDKEQRHLIPGEGIRRTAGTWADGREYDPDALVEEIRQLRNPTRR